MITAQKDHDNLLADADRLGSAISSELDALSAIVPQELSARLTTLSAATETLIDLVHAAERYR